MLKYNLSRLFHLKGVKSPGAFLLKAGFTKNVAYNLIEGRFVSIPAKSIEKLCIALDCTPNDLMEWIPDEKHPISDCHPLRKLSAVPLIDLRNVSENVPVDRLAELSKVIEDWKKKVNISG